MADKAGAKGDFVVGFGRAHGDVEDGAGALFNADRGNAHLRLVVVNRSAAVIAIAARAVIGNGSGAAGVCAHELGLAGEQEGLAALKDAVVGGADRHRQSRGAHRHGVAAVAIGDDHG